MAGFCYIVICSPWPSLVEALGLRISLDSHMRHALVTWAGLYNLALDDFTFHVLSQLGGYTQAVYVTCEDCPRSLGWIGADSRPRAIIVMARVSCQVFADRAAYERARGLPRRNRALRPSCAFEVYDADPTLRPGYRPSGSVARGRRPSGSVAEVRRSSGSVAGVRRPFGGGAMCCRCGVAAVRRTTRSGRNAGREYYSCEGRACVFFRWVAV